MVSGEFEAGALGGYTIDAASLRRVDPPHKPYQHFEAVFEVLEGGPGGTKLAGSHGPRGSACGIVDLRPERVPCPERLHRSPGV